MQFKLLSILGTATDDIRQFLDIQVILLDKVVQRRLGWFGPCGNNVFMESHRMHCMQDSKEKETQEEEGCTG